MRSTQSPDVGSTSPDAPLPFDQTDDFLHSALEQEILRSERIRALMLAATFALFLFTTLLTALGPFGLDRIWAEQIRTHLGSFTALIGLGIAYELGMAGLFGACLRSGTRPAPFVRWANAFIEISFPTAYVVVSINMVDDPMDALSASTSWFYFLFIILSAMHLRPMICVFSGTMAAAQHIALGIIQLWPSLPNLTLDPLHRPSQFINRGIMLILAGLFAAFLARQVKREFLASVRFVRALDRAVSIFGQHVSPAVARTLLEQTQRSDGERRSVCVMFLDVRDFSRFANVHGSEEIMRYLNSIFGFMIEVISRHEGIINKFLGDGFMAVFGAPTGEAGMCTRATAAAREIIERVEQLSESGEIPPTRIGVGLHAGEVVTGNIGSEERKEFTVIGDAVNVAARVEQATKQFNARLLITDAVWTRLDASQREGEDLGLVDLRGQSQPVRLHMLM